jgi:hypothetical protein
LPRAVKPGEDFDVIVGGEIAAALGQNLGSATAVAALLRARRPTAPKLRPRAAPRPVDPVEALAGQALFDEDRGAYLASFAIGAKM